MTTPSHFKSGFAGWRLVAGILIVAGLVALNQPAIRQSHEKWSNELVNEQLLRVQMAKIAYMVDKELPLDEAVTLDELMRHALEIEARIAMDRERYEMETEQYDSGLEIKPAKPVDYRGTLKEAPFFAIPGKLVLGKLGELPKYITDDGREIVADFEAIYGIDPAQFTAEPS
jgi:hypothetical protein